MKTENKGVCPSCGKKGKMGDGCPDCPGFWFDRGKRKPLAERRLKRANELLHRVYNEIEMSHLNDFKLNTIYCTSINFPRGLGEDIFDHLQNDTDFKKTVIKRQVRYRRKMKRQKAVS